MPDLFNPKQLAEYLQLSQRTVYRLLERGDIPAVKVGGQWRFRKSAIDEWLDLGMRRFDSAELEALEGDEPARTPRLSELILLENALISVAPADAERVVRDFVARVRFPEPVSPETAAERILQRERMCSTALSDGVALLHTPRTGPRLLAHHDMVAVGRLGAPIPFGALDGSPTDTLLLLLARSERDQLALLAKVARLCREADFVAGIHAARSAADVIELVRRSEARVFPRTD